LAGDKEVQTRHPHFIIFTGRNVGNSEQAFSLAFLPNDGIGLAREEFIISSAIQVHPLALVHFDTLYPSVTHRRSHDQPLGQS
jgi:hypothetical protein